MATKADEATRVQEKPFRFLDLPSELRCLVYDYLLANVGEIDLIRASGKLKRKSRSCREVYPSIVFVNKKVNAEAIPILYSGNCFYGEDVTDITYLLTHCGDSARHLRHIRVHFHTCKTYIKSMVQELKVAKDLSTLALPWEMIQERTTERYFHSPGSLAEELAPVYKAWQEQQAKDTVKKARSLEGVLQIHYGCQPTAPPDERMLCHEVAKKLVLRVKEELAKVLG